MKNTKLLLVAAILLCSGSLFAQWGIHAGPLFSSMTIKHSSSFSMDFKSRVGFTGGIAYKRAFGSSLALQGEVNYTQKGGKWSENWAIMDFNLNFLEVPIYFLYAPGGSSGFFIGAGPSFNFGLSGKWKLVGGEIPEEEDVNFGSGDEDDLKGFHLGVNALAGYQLPGGLNFNAFIAQSITNSSPTGDDAEKVKFFNFGVRVGYFFHNNGAAAASRLKQPF